MTKDDTISIAKEAGLYTKCDVYSAVPFDQLLHRFAELLIQRERDELIVIFLEAHEGVKHIHNHWLVAANKIKGRT